MVPAGNGESVIFFFSQVLAILILRDHVSVDFITRDGIGKIDQIRSVSPSRSHIAFQGDKFSFFGEALFV